VPKTMRHTPILVAALGLAAVAPGVAFAQSGAQANAWAAWCTSKEIGGRVDNSGGNPVCIPGAAAAGGYSTDQQAMLDLASQFGNALGAAIRQSFEHAARQEQINRMQEAWEREQAKRQAAAEYEKQKQRNQALIAGMKDAVGASELGRTQLGTEQLRLRTADELFGNGGGDRGVLAQEVPVSAPVDLADMLTRQEAFFRALDDVSEAEAALRAKQTHIQIMRNLTAELEIRRDQQKLALSLIPVGDARRAGAEAEFARLEGAIAEGLPVEAEDLQELAQLEAEAEEAREALRAAGAQPASADPARP